MKKEITRTNILNALRGRPMSVMKMAKKLGMRRDVLGGYLRSLEDYGIAESYLIGKSRVYRLKKKQK